MPAIAAVAAASSFWAAASVSAVRLGPPSLVGDLAVTPVQAGSEPSPFPQAKDAGDLGYFGANDGLHGQELWRTDGAAPGTYPLSDLCPGACGSSPVPVARVGDRLFFETRGWGENKVRPALWATDGTREGTRLLLRGSVSYGVAFRGELWFARDGSLWRSDGTAAGTRPMVEVCGEGCGAGPLDLTVVGDQLFFSAVDPDLGMELWASDGTAAGTGLVADACPGPCHGDPLTLTPFGDRLVFLASDGVHGYELWVSDGTAAGTSMVVDLAPGPAGPDVIELQAFDGRLYFVVHHFFPPAPPELWRTDGTEAGTEPVPAVVPQGASTVHLGPVLARGDRLLILASGGGTVGLHAYDRTTRTRRLLASGSRLAQSRVKSGGRIGENLLFLAAGAPSGRLTLWRTDGTPEGTAVLREFDLGGALVQPMTLAPVAGGETLLFAGPDGLGGHEPWITDGTAAGTALLEEIRPPRASSDPREVTRRHGGWVYFVADGEAGDGALWRAPASSGRLELVDARRPWGRLVAAGSRLFAISADRTVVARVEDDGAGVRILAEPRSLVNEPTAVGDRLFFGTEGEGQELWVSDGTEEGTRLVIDLDPSWTDGCHLPVECGADVSVFPEGLLAAGEALYFFAPPPSFRGSLAPGLWRSDGTADGTVPLTEERFIPLGAAAVGERLVFTVHSLGGEFRLLWASDGTPEGTGPLHAASAGPEIDLIGGPLAAGEGVLYLVLSGPDGTSELWATDGTPTGTRGITALETRGVGVGSVGEAKVTGEGRLFFAAEHPLLGEELWTSDGTAEGTGPVADLAAGPESSRPTSLTPFQKGVLFAAAGDGAGYELWASDGSAGGTRRLTDLHPGPGASDPSGITVSPEALLFAADDGEAGRELWRATILGSPLPPPEPPTPEGPPIVSQALPGFRFWVRISAGADERRGAPLTSCFPETVCIAGAVPDRAEVLLRIVGPKPNGRLWPSLVKLSTSRVEVWIEQVDTGLLRYYVLEGAGPGSSELPGRFDRTGFPPV